jgi:hypothetical protein
MARAQDVHDRHTIIGDHRSSQMHAMTNSLQQDTTETNPEGPGLEHYEEKIGRSCDCFAGRHTPTQRDVRVHAEIVGCALLEIRERELFRAVCPDFEDYCRERFAFDRDMVKYVLAHGLAAVRWNN